MTERRDHIELYDFPLSIYCQMVRIALAEKGAQYSTRHVDITQRGEQFEAAYLAVNPRAVVPTLVLDGEVHLEAKHILRTIDERLGGRPLSPARPEERACMDEWMLRADAIDYAALLYAAKVTPDGTCPPLLGRLAKLRAVRERSPELAGSIDPRISDLVALLPKLGSEQGRAATRAETIRALHDLEAIFADGRQWIAGASYSLADVMWTATLARCEMQHLDAWHDDALPSVARYYAALKSRPSFAAAGVITRAPEAFGGVPVVTTAARA